MKAEEVAEYHQTEVWEQDHGIIVYGTILLVLL